MTRADKIGLCILAAVILIAAMFMHTVPQPTPITVEEVYSTDRLPDLIEDVRGSVVHVAKLGQCQGSGCLISADGIIFTAKHVSDGEYGEYEVTLDDGRKFKTKPGYVLEDKENDITFMQLDLDGREPNLPYANLAHTDRLRVGEQVFIMGSPLGYKNFNAVSTGILAAMGRDLAARSSLGKRYDWHVMLHSTSPAYPGNSGGPVFDMRGNVVGVLVAGVDSTMNFSVPVARFRDTIDAVRDHFRLCRFDVIGEPEPEQDYNEFYQNFQDWCLNSN